MEAAYSVTFEMMPRGKMSSTCQTSILAMTMDGFHVIMKGIEFFEDSITLRTKKHHSLQMNAILLSFIFHKDLLNLPRKYVTAKS